MSEARLVRIEEQTKAIKETVEELASITKELSKEVTTIKTDVAVLKAVTGDEPSTVKPATIATLIASSLVAILEYLK